LGIFAGKKNIYLGRVVNMSLTPTALFTGEREEEQTLVNEKMLYRREKRDGIY